MSSRETHAARYIAELAELCTARSLTSACSFRELRGLYKIPNSLAGLKILDIGAGASDFTAQMLEKGADAHAVDPRFADFTNLRQGITEIVDEYRRRGDHQTANKDRATGDRFIRSYQATPNRYRAASAHRLPFNSQEFDLCFSSSAILSYLDLHPDLLIQSTAEAVRVTKPKGTIQFAPYIHSIYDQPLEEFELRNYAYSEWREWLSRQSNLKFQLIQHPSGNFSTAQIAVQ